MFRKGGQSTALVSQGRRKVHTTFDGGAELVEEYDAKTGELLVRKRREKSTTGRECDWEYLIGEPPARWAPDQGLMKESSLNPLFSRHDKPDVFQWRIRNLPYPQETYSVTVSPEDRKIVLRTSNKKYFKKWSVPELDLFSVELRQEALTWSHANTTLVICYAKPAEVTQAEREEAEENKKLRVKEDGDMDCKQQ